jgi:cytochrome c peroxidase
VGAALLTAWAALPPVPVPAGNPITEEKRVLGKILFFDEQLSTSMVVSCATCHAPTSGGADPRIARHPGDDLLLNTPDDVLGSAGIIRSDAGNNFQRDPVFALQPQITDRAANSNINAAYAPLLFWDGRASGVFRDPVTNQVLLASNAALESQAAAPLLNSVEMAHADFSWADLSAKLGRVRPLDLATSITPDVAPALAGGASYAALFQRAFGDPAITPARIAMAIATYQRTLVSDQTPYDRFLEGQPGALTAAQQRGLMAFRASNCATCHQEPLLTDHTFRNVGLRPPAEDLGRAGVTNNPADRGRFRVPGLRNVGLKPTHFHNGAAPTVRAVVDFYARANPNLPQFPENRDPIMQNVNVPPQARPDLTDFLANALTDPRVRDGLFPFDAPTLFTAPARAGDRATLVGGGVPGAGGVLPRIIVQAPSMVGNLDYRVGLDVVVGGATARLGVSTVAPVNGLITPERYLGAVTAGGVGPGAGTATLHYALRQGRVRGGDVLFVQWFIDDPAAPGGVAASAVARVPFFCGSSGCPSDCAADLNNDGEATFDDIQVFVAWHNAGDRRADYNDDREFTFDDVMAFVQAYNAGC